jgi:hypothetical protein
MEKLDRNPLAVLDAIAALADLIYDLRGPAVGG